MLSIVIPVLNEEEHILKLLKHLLSSGDNLSDLEILLVDGGSTDDTIDILQGVSKDHPTAITLLESKKGRAVQMNAGATAARGDIFYFLHADSYPPKGFDSLIKKEIKRGNPAGCFQMKFDNNHWWLRLAGWFTRFNWRACRGGDQSQFITRALFDEIGGYNECYAVYEDNILLNELYARKKFVVIPEKLISSARLYEEKGIWYVQYHFLVIYLKKWLGADADVLLDYYNRKIGNRSSSKKEVVPDKPVRILRNK